MKLAALNAVDSATGKPSLWGEAELLPKQDLTGGICPLPFSNPITLHLEEQDF